MHRDCFKAIFQRIEDQKKQQKGDNLRPQAASRKTPEPTCRHGVEAYVLRPAGKGTFCWNEMQAKGSVAQEGDPAFGRQAGGVSETPHEMKAEEIGCIAGASSHGACRISRTTSSKRRPQRASQDFPAPCCHLAGSALETPRWRPAAAAASPLAPRGASRVTTPILWSIRQTRTEKMATAPGGFQKISLAAPPKEARRRAGSIPRRRCLPGPQGGSSDQERHNQEDSLGAAERPHTGARTAGSKRQHCRYCQALTNPRRRRTKADPPPAPAAGQSRGQQAPSAYTADIAKP